MIRLFGFLLSASVAVAGSVIHYPLNESSGKIANDASGNGRHAYATNAAPGWRPGQGIIGGAIEFTPTSQTDVSQMFTNALSGAPDLPFSLSAWIKTTAVNANNKCVVFYGDGTNVSSYYTLNVSGTQKVQANARNTTIFSAEYATAINDGKWHHIVGVYYSTTNRVLFVDGTPVAVNTSSVNSPPRSRFGLGVLTRGAPTDAFMGWVDDVGLWNDALSTNKVALLNGLGRMAQVALSDPAVDAVLGVFNAQSGSASAGPYAWTYATGLSGGLGAIGTNAGRPFIVLNAAGQGVRGQLQVGLSVALVTPTNNAAFNIGAPIPILAAVTTNFAPAQRVDFYTSGSLLVSVSNAPFTTTWTNAVAGSWTLTAVATDTNGLSTTSSVANITVTTLAGITTALTTPTNNAVLKFGQPIALQAIVVTNGAGLRQLDFYADTTLLDSRSNAPFLTIWTNAALGNYALTAVATDTNGLSATSAVVNVSVQIIAGVTGTMTSPTNGAVFNLGVPITLAAVITTNGSTAKQTDFYDGATWLGSAASAPFTLTWEGAALGLHALTAVATDAEDLRATSAVVNVTVKSDLLIHYALDEESGQTAADSATAIGGSQSASTGNAAPQWLPTGGIIGGALRLSSAAQTTVTEAFSYDSPTILVTNFPLTISVWVKASGGSTWARDAVFLGEPAAFDRYFQVGLNIAAPNGGNAGARSSATGGLIAANSPTNLPVADDTWHHLAGVFSAANGRILYLDGVAVATNTTSVAFATNNTRFSIGALMRSTPTDAYYGMLDDVGLWSAGLSPERIALIHGLGRYAAVDLGSISIDAVLGVYYAHGGSALIGTNAWSYTNGVTGSIGATGTNADGTIYIVLGAGDGVTGGTPVPPPPQFGLVISEVMAANQSGLQDEDLDHPDWIELLNAQSSSQSLDGWYLSDDPGNLTKWAFPSNIVLTPYQNWAVFASGKNKFGNAYPHTSFTLPKEGGTILLVQPDGTTVASQITYPAQVDDVSWGATINGTNLIYGFLATATPNAANSTTQATNPPAEKPLFNRPSGVLLAASTLEILPPTAPDAVVRYTTNGAEPTALSPAYTGPIPISGTTVRARTFRPGWLPSAINNRHFILLGADLQDYNASGQPFSSSLPVLVIDSFGRNIDAENSIGYRPWRATMAALFDVDGTGRTSVTNVPTVAERGGMHIHGQTSASFAQRPYAWEIWKDSEDTDKPVSLLGMPAESDWVLNGPYFEKSLMRNFLAYSWMRQLNGSQGASRIRFVEVFFNQNGGDVSYSDYRGIYVLVEKIKRDKDRIAIETLNPSMTSTSLLSGGYIFKRDKTPYSAPFNTASGVPLDIYEPNDVTTVQINALRSFLNSFEAALTNANFAVPATGYRAFAETATFIDNHLLVESTFQIDGFRVSSYFTKDRGGKIRALPIWDYDRCMGSAYNWNNGGYVGWYYTNIATATPWNIDYAWYPRLFQDPEFATQYWDRYWQLRRSLLSLAALSTQVDATAALLTEGYTGDINAATPATVQNPAARHFRRWNLLGQNIIPNSAGWDTRTNYQREVEFLKTWMTNRLGWMDAQHSQPPTFSQYGGAVASGYPLAMGNPNTNGSIYYTLDGSDPRVAYSGAVAPGAAIYTDPVTLTDSTQVRARVLAGTNWSPLSDAVFAVAAVPASSNNLVISEIMYHPSAATPAEVAAGFSAASDFEYLEFLNTSAGHVDLSGVTITRGVTFTFASNLPPSVLVLPSGGRVLTVGNTNAFVFRYGPSAATRVAGQQAGNLSNGGERLTVLAADGKPIADFSYGDGNSWPTLPDGFGFSLVLKTEAANQDFGAGANWSQSSSLNGTPGAAPLPFVPANAIWISEALTFGANVADEFIELHNPNSSSVNIGGWFLTDDLHAPFKFRFADGASVPAHGFLVLSNRDYSAAFTLAHDGGTLWLLASDLNTNLTGFTGNFDYGNAEPGVSFGRYINSAGDEDIVAQSANTPGLSNAAPHIGPVVISEIHYHPLDLGLTNNMRDEFIELANVTASPVGLFDPAQPTNTWHLRNAVSFDFPANFTLPPHGRVVVVGFDPTNDPVSLAAFTAQFQTDSSTPILGPWSNWLGNKNETIELKKPGQPTTNGVPYIMVEKVNYRDSSPWPTNADGLGASLHRAPLLSYANDPAHWMAATPSLGVTEVILTGQVQLEYFIGASRAVTFAVSDGETFTNRAEQTLSFSDGVASYSVSAPPGISRLSAKTAWTLRQAVTVTPAHGEATADFTGADLLLAGDLDGSNFVDLGDYFILAGAWSTPNPAADLDGSGWVDLDDYFLLSNHWNEPGEPE